MTHDRQPLATHVAIYKQIKQQIASEYGLKTDDPVVLDTAEGESDLHGLLIALLREARHAKSMADGIAELMKQTAERKARLEAKHDRLRSIVLHAMADAGLPRLEAPDFTAARRPGRPSVVLTADASQIPDDLCRIVREPDKKAIAAALNSGRTLTFAYLSNADECLTVRS